jgi:hypothetical protein
MSKITEVSEDTMLGMSLKTLATLGGALVIGTIAYLDLKAGIAEAKELPPPTITRVEYELKDELVRSAIMETQKQVEQIAQDLNRIEAYILQQGR